MWWPSGWRRASLSRLPPFRSCCCRAAPAIGARACRSGARGGEERSPCKIRCATASVEVTRTVAFGITCLPAYRLRPCGPTPPASPGCCYPLAPGPAEPGGLAQEGVQHQAAEHQLGPARGLGRWQQPAIPRAGCHRTAAHAQPRAQLPAAAAHREPERLCAAACLCLARGALCRGCQGGAWPRAACAVTCSASCPGQAGFSPGTACLPAHVPSARQGFLHAASAAGAATHHAPAPTGLRPLFLLRLLRQGADLGGDPFNTSVSVQLAPIHGGW